jgi:hypothetical protein
VFLGICFGMRDARSLGVELTTKNCVAQRGPLWISPPPTGLISLR